MIQIRKLAILCTEFHFSPSLSHAILFILCSLACFLSLCVCPYHPFRPCLFCSSACFPYAVSPIYFSFFVALFLPFPLALPFLYPLFSVRSVLFLTLSLHILFSLLSPIRCLSLNNSARAVQDTSMNYVARSELTSAVLKARSHTAY